MGRRIWNDEQLREAVAAHRSWREVMRAIGLKGSSSIHLVQRRALELNLDTSHFTGPRRWSDQQLVVAISESQSWSDVAGRLGLAREARTELRLRGHAVRLGLETSHLDDPPSTGPTIEDLRRPANPSELRNAGPSIAAAWFSLRGLPVAIPAEPQAYDLLVTARDGIRRVQVKTTTCQMGNSRWQVGIGHRPYSLDNSATKAPYDPDSLDIFVIINGDGELYLIPIEAVAGLTVIYLSAYQQYKVGDVSRLFA